MTATMAALALSTALKAIELDAHQREELLEARADQSIA